MLKSLFYLFLYLTILSPLGGAIITYIIFTKPNYNPYEQYILNGILIFIILLGTYFHLLCCFDYAKKEIKKILYLNFGYYFAF